MIGFLIRAAHSCCARLELMDIDSAVSGCIGGPNY